MGNGTGGQRLTRVSVGPNDESDTVRIGDDKVYVYKTNDGIRVGCHFITDKAFQVIRAIYEKKRTA